MDPTITALIVAATACTMSGGLTDAYGIQGNNFYNSGFHLKWFTA